MGSFALPSGYNWDVKLFTRQVKTKKWSKEFSHKLGKYAEQILAKLDSGHIAKIKLNVIQAVYY